MKNESLEKIVQMIVRYRLEGLPFPEQEELHAWRQESERHERLFRHLCDDDELCRRLQMLDSVEVEKALLRNRRLLRRHEWGRGIKKCLPYAAVIMLCFGVALLWEKEPVPEIVAEQLGEPGRRAELILADGSSVHLDDATEKVVSDGIHEVVVKSHEVDYSASNQAAGSAFHIIRTPLGGEYSVTLSDSTRVWLNALSELRYPVSFEGRERRVELKGEAYFEVNREENGRPFYVVTGDYRVQVLGTSFDVRAYGDENCWRTTLCSGKVELADMRNHRVISLSPGEQVRCDRQSQRMEVAKVDPQVYMSWINGEFRFDDTPLEEIFTVLQRWYRVEVFYINERVRQELFTGKLPRFDSLEVMLEIMAKVSKVKFTVNGNTVFVQ